MNYSTVFIYLDYLLVALYGNQGGGNVGGKNGGKKGGKNGGKNGGANPGKKGGKNGGKNGGKKGPGAAGVAELLLAELSESKIVLFNLTTNVYGVPLFSPVTVIGEAEPVAVILPGEDVVV